LLCGHPDNETQRAKGLRVCVSACLKAVCLQSIIECMAFHDKNPHTVCGIATLRCVAFQSCEGVTWFHLVCVCVDVAFPFVGVCGPIPILWGSLVSIYLGWKLTHFPIHRTKNWHSIKKIEVRYPLLHTFSGLLFFHGVCAFNNKIWHVIWVFPALLFHERQRAERTHRRGFACIDIILI
jgi:hypothetical protein